MSLREYVFKTSSDANLLCQWTRREPHSWILIRLLPPAGPNTSAALFTLQASEEAIDRFLKEEFGRKYGTFEVLYRGEGFASVEVSNYLLPAYRGVDPVEMAKRLLGPDAFFDPLLVHEGYIFIKVIASPRDASRNFAELLKRFSAATRPSDFQLIHTGEWNPVLRLKPRDDALTQRQQEALKLAIEFGYYDEPRRCTLNDVAQAFGISKAALHKRLLVAESKIIKNYER